MRVNRGIHKSLSCHQTHRPSDSNVQSTARLHGSSGLDPKTRRAVQAAFFFACFLLAEVVFSCHAHAQAWTSPTTKPSATTQPSWQPAKPAQSTPPSPAPPEPAATQTTRPTFPPAPPNISLTPTAPAASNAAGDQSQSLFTNFTNYFTADLLLYAGIGLLSLGAMIWLVQRVKGATVAAQGQKAAPTEAGFSIQEIQRLKDQGLLSEREYQKAMARAGAPEEPPSTPDSPPPASPDAGPPKGPPSGTSPNPRNGELW